MLLRFGSVGEPVRKLQDSLNNLPPTRFALLDTDGIFGGKTYQRVCEFQGNNQLAPDGLVGPLTLNMISALIEEQWNNINPLIKTYRYPKRVTLHIACVYLASYNNNNEMAKDNIEAANNLLDAYNMELSVWPDNAAKRSDNVLIDQKYKEDIPDTKSAYVKLRKDVNHLIQNKVPRYPAIVPIIFCEFEDRSLAITPHSTKTSTTESPACLISMGAKSEPDNLVILHEMGHSALYPKHTHNKNPRNLMYDASHRDYLFRFQVEAFAHAIFASHGQ